MRSIFASYSTEIRSLADAGRTGKWEISFAVHASPDFGRGSINCFSEKKTCSLPHFFSPVCARPPDELLAYMHEPGSRDELCRAEIARGQGRQRQGGAENMGCEVSRSLMCSTLKYSLTLKGYKACYKGILHSCRKHDLLTDMDCIKKAHIAPSSPKLRQPVPSHCVAWRNRSLGADSPVEEGPRDTTLLSAV